jgi:hypothetical protein
VARALSAHTRPWTWAESAAEPARLREEA